MFDQGYGAEAKIFIYIFLNDWIVFAECNMHLHGSLAVSNVADLLVRSAIDIGEDSWEIVVGHVLEGELPKLFIFIWVVSGMVSRVLVPSAVPHPHIVPSVCQHKSWGLILVVDQPRIRAVQQPMLQKNRSKALFHSGSLLLHSENGQQVSILGEHLMGLCRVFEEFAVFKERQFCFGVNCSLCAQQKAGQEEQGAKRDHKIQGDI